MKITRVEVRPMAVYWADIFGGEDKVPESFWRPSANFMGVRRREGQFSTFVIVETDEGVSGIGEGWGLPDPLVSATIAERLLAPVLIGQDPFAIDYLWDTMYESIYTGLPRPYVLEAMSAIDIALWDLKGKALGLPIVRLLGGPHRSRVETYASPVPFLPPAPAVAKAQEFIAKGFRSIKLKIGRSPAADLAMVAAVREAVGPDILIVTDANCGMTVPQAIQMGKALAEYGVEWLEEPLAVTDRAGLAEVRHAVDIAVVTGENEHHTDGILALLQARATDAVQINVTRTGGITGARRIAQLAHSYGVPLAPHGVGSAIGVAATLHLMGAIPNAWIYEYNQLLNPLRDDLLAQPLPFADGYLEIPTGPGLGITLQDGVFERYKLRR